MHRWLFVLLQLASFLFFTMQINLLPPRCPALQQAWALWLAGTICWVFFGPFQLNTGVFLAFRKSKPHGRVEIPYLCFTFNHTSFSVNVSRAEQMWVTGPAWQDQVSNSWASDQQSRALAAAPRLPHALHALCDAWRCPSGCVPGEWLSIYPSKPNYLCASLCTMLKGLLECQSPMLNLLWSLLIRSE